MKNKTQIIVAILITFLLSGCIWMYSTRPGTIPPHIKDVAIAETKNNTAEFNLGQDFTTLLIDKMRLDNLLPITDAAVANSIIYTGFTRISDAVYSYDETDVVKEYKLTLNMDFRWYDALNDTDIMKKGLSEYKIYYSDSYNNSLSDDNKMTREMALELLKDELANQVLIELTSQW